MKGMRQVLPAPGPRPPVEDVEEVVEDEEFPEEGDAPMEEDIEEGKKSASVCEET